MLLQVCMRTETNLIICTILIFTLQISYPNCIHTPLHFVAVELKEGHGRVYEGQPPAGQQPTAIVRVQDADFVKLVGGQLDGTRVRSTTETWAQRLSGLVLAPSA